MAGKTAWQKDAFKHDEKLDPMSDSLNEAAKEKLDWLFLLTQSYVFCFIKNLVEPELRADITKTISETKCSNTIMVWHIFKLWIRSKLVDYSPHLLLELIQTMIRPSNMTAIYWSTTFVQIRKVLFDKYLQPIIGIIAWFYWASQVTVSEWAIIRDTLDFPTTLEEKAALSPATFLHHASLVAKSACQTFDIMSKDAEPIRAH